MSNEIPTRSREIVTQRDGHHCMRCGAADSHDTHHRRRRRENPDGLAHDPCNLITLCRVCHAWCHANPKQAKDEGFVVAPHDSPLEVPIHASLWDWSLLTPDGMFILCGVCDECLEMTPVENGLCPRCLAKQICCGSATSAAKALCGCGGAAASALARLQRRLEPLNL